MNDLNVANKDALIIILDLADSSFWGLTRSNEHERERLSQKNVDIPVTPSVVWLSIIRFIHVVKIGWPTLYLVILGAYPEDVLTIHRGLVEVFDVKVATEKIHDFEKNRDPSIYASGSKRLHKKESDVIPPTNSALMSTALGQAVMILNCYMAGSSTKGKGRIFIVDAAGKYAYVPQESTFCRLLHVAVNLSITIDVLVLRSFYAPILESLCDTTGGLFLCYPRVMLVDLRDAGSSYSLPVKFMDDGELRDGVLGLMDFISFHYLPPVNIRQHLVFRKERAIGAPCVCHSKFIIGPILLCPSCGAVYCISGRTPAICQICKLRMKRTPLNQQKLSDMFLTNQQ